MQKKSLSADSVGAQYTFDSSNQGNTIYGHFLSFSLEEMIPVMRQLFYNGLIGFYYLPINEKQEVTS